jgi:hypothetical protein
MPPRFAEFPSPFLSLRRQLPWSAARNMLDSSITAISSDEQSRFGRRRPFPDT